MNARDMRDVIAIVVLPSLERAIVELAGKRGVAGIRVLVQASRDQLAKMMPAAEVKPGPHPVVVPELAHASRLLEPFANADPARRLQASEDCKHWVDVVMVTIGYRWYRYVDNPEEILDRTPEQSPALGNLPCQGKPE